MKICEIFDSIQGESSHAGLPCVFIRMAGCNLRCVYCDTAYAYDEGFEITEKEVIEKVEEYGIQLVEITGGEPLLQSKEVLLLIDKLIENGFDVLVETNGSINIKDINAKATIIMDVKTPGSGMYEKMFIANFNYLKPNDEIKFVILHRNDYEWAKEFIFTHKLIKKCKILFSPTYGILSPEVLSEWIIADRLPIRLNLQIHKYIFGNDRRAV